MIQHMTPLDAKDTEAEVLDLVSPQTAATMLGCSAQHVRRLIHRGDLPAKFIPNQYHGRYIIARADIEALAGESA